MIWPGRLVSVQPFALRVAFTFCTERSDPLSTYSIRFLSSSASFESSMCFLHLNPLPVCFVCGLPFCFLPSFPPFLHPSVFLTCSHACSLTESKAGLAKLVLNTCAAQAAALTPTSASQVLELETRAATFSSYLFISLAVCFAETSFICYFEDMVRLWLDLKLSFLLLWPF